jgi:hypothetical protein
VEKAADLGSGRRPHFNGAGRERRGVAGVQGRFYDFARQRVVGISPLKELVRVLDARHGTAHDAAIERTFDRKDEEGTPRITEQLFGVLTDYIFTAFEIHLALLNRPVYLALRDAVGHLQEALSPSDDARAIRRERFDRERRRILTLLRMGLAP